MIKVLLLFYLWTIYRIIVFFLFFLAILTINKLHLIILDRTTNKNLQEKSFFELLTPETNPLMNHNKEIRDELQAFVDLIKTVRRVRHRRELECRVEDLLSDIRPNIKESKAIYFQGIGKQFLSKKVLFFIKKVVFVQKTN